MTSERRESRDSAGEVRLRTKNRKHGCAVGIVNRAVPQGGLVPRREVGHGSSPYRSLSQPNTGGSSMDGTWRTSSGEKVTIGVISRIKATGGRVDAGEISARAHRTKDVPKKHRRR